VQIRVLIKVSWNVSNLNVVGNLNIIWFSNFSYLYKNESNPKNVLFCDRNGLHT
jgi:hypothetical protein